MKQNYMEYQVKRMTKNGYICVWVHRSRSTYYRDRKKGEEVRKRDLRNGPVWNYE